MIKTLPSDLIAGLVVFLVALPLCLGVALASNAPLFSGILGGIIGGILVGLLSGSSTSVSGPAAGLAAVVAAEIHKLGSFEAFLLAVVIAGAIQVLLSICRMGFIAAYFPTSVIKGLLFAIGVILVVKQVPHLIGLSGDTFHLGALIIGLVSLSFLVFIKSSKVPTAVIVVVFGVIAGFFLQLSSAELVQVPVLNSFEDAGILLTFPDFSSVLNPDVYSAALTIAFVASLETLLNLEAVDKIDPEGRTTPANRELFAQGIGNITGGLIGAIPITSVIVRSSVNINAGVKTKLSTIWHGILILSCVLLIPNWLNHIPLSALAAILFVTGFKLASPKILKEMWQEGRNQFLPFILTVSAIILTDLLIGVLIGLGIAICFILESNIRRPLKKVIERYAGGDEVLHIELPNQMSFFNKKAFENTLNGVPSGQHVLVNARNTDYIDPDILNLIADFQQEAEKKEIKLSLSGFNGKGLDLSDRIQYVDFTSQQMQAHLTPEKVLECLREGNNRFRKGLRLTRDIERQLEAASSGQYPMAVVLSCIDSRAPVELVFDLSIGDIFSVRIAGNVVSRKVLGSMEYACKVAGAKLVLVMGHTGCGAVRASVEFMCKDKTAKEETGCVNLDSLIQEVTKSVDQTACRSFKNWDPKKKEEYCNEVSYRNVLRTIEDVRQNSSTLNALVKEGKVAIVGALYNIKNGEVTFFQSPTSSPNLEQPYPEQIFAKLLKKASSLNLFKVFSD